ncbi:DNA helicase [Pseudomonas phage PspYZU05]|uniref:DNA helicase n=1 Tax=Pseudomonas phage PspYZU05 TaxID=1983556 RepID=A0A2U7NRX4_9CAUD|nr:DNA helicase [Pseudomonas phage PspYZU05]ASD51982.1 DNA helicase [Pseudomonas phage PspYZU05]
MVITFDDLTEGQKLAFNEVVDAIKTQNLNLRADTKTHITINGEAGTGKTTLTKFLIDYIIKEGINGVILAAPTHAAKTVLSKLSGMEAETIHSVLKISPTNYEDQTVFEQREIPNLAECRILICDEGSMYDRKLVQLILNTVPKWCLVIVLGDKEQIRPVSPGETLPGISPFFTHKKFKQIKLTEVKRSNGPIITVAREILKGQWLRECLDEDGQGVHAYDPESDIPSLHWFLKEYFKVVKTKEDFVNTRVMAYTNKVVNTLNKIIRKRIFNTDEPFIEDEIIVMQGPLTESLIVDGKKVKKLIYNNGQRVRIVRVNKTVHTLRARFVESTKEIDVWTLTVETADKNIDEYHLKDLHIVDEGSELVLKEFLSETANTYRYWELPGKAPWGEFWTIKERYSNVKAEPCSTIHKAQGISVDNAFLCTSGLSSMDPDLVKELIYVGSTRPKHNLYWI